MKKYLTPADKRHILSHYLSPLDKRRRMYEIMDRARMVEIFKEVKSVANDNQLLIIENYLNDGKDS